MKYYDSLVNRVSFPHLTKEKLEIINFVFPPIDEQNKIVEYLDNKITKIENLILKEEKKLKLLEEYKTSLISEVISGNLKI